MEYTINKLAKLAGVSTRTMRYYDEIELLKPKRVSSNGYRIYSSDEIKRLQRILFYKELGVQLEDIRKILSSEGFDEQAALENHLVALMAKHRQIDLLISNVKKTIQAKKREFVMSDKEKFEGFKRKLVDKDERQFGQEIRLKYGDNIIDRSNAKVMGMDKKQYDEVQALSAELNQTLNIDPV